MPKQIARYTVTSGLAGCYMPDSVSGPLAFSTRAELADFIRYEIEAQEFPKSSFAQAHIRGIWRRIAKFGSSVQHFSIEHNGREIAFHGLTEEEFEQAEAADPF